MYALITGTFEGEGQAILAVRKLLRACVPANCVRAILPGSRRRLAAHEAEGGAKPAEPGAVMVAVKATDNVSGVLAVKVLQEHGAQEIERTDAERRAAPQRRARRSIAMPPAEETV